MSGEDKGKERWTKEGGTEEGEWVERVTRIDKSRK